MNRTAWLQDRRMQKFRDVLSRWERKELSALEAGELLGCSERQFRRYRVRYEEDGLAGLIDRRLGRASARRVPVDRIAWMLEEYRTCHMGWTVKHFHEHLAEHHGFAWGYSWTKAQLHTSGLVERARRRGAHRRKRPRKPCEGMMLHQDGSTHIWLEGEAPLDLIVTMDDATSTIYSGLLVEQEGTASSFQGLLETFTAQGLPASLYTDRGSHYFFTPQAARCKWAQDRTVGFAGSPGHWKRLWRV
jgi:transposase